MTTCLSPILIVKGVRVSSLPDGDGVALTVNCTRVDALGPQVKEEGPVMVI